MIITINSNRRIEILKKLPVGTLFIIDNDIWLVCRYGRKRKYIQLKKGLISDFANDDTIKVEILQDSITLENELDD